MIISDLLIILNLFLLETMLSIDNSAVLAVMVKDLPDSERNEALRYGLFGAFAFRGFCLVLATWIAKLFYLKIAGGLYLMYLCNGHFRAGNQTIEEGVDKKHNPVYLWIKNKIGAFWATVMLVEIMDLAFSIDNIFAATAMTKSLILIYAGVFMGIVAMRFVAGAFVRILKDYPVLENSAFIVIGILGVKLVVTGITQNMQNMAQVNALFNSHTFDLVFSAVMMGIFFLPVIWARIKGLWEVIML